MPSGLPHITPVPPRHAQTLTIFKNMRRVAITLAMFLNNVTCFYGDLLKQCDVLRGKFLAVANLAVIQKFSYFG